ncbi:hypothetical protein ACFQVA_38990 [Actinomadura keratinilytica]
MAEEFAGETAAVRPATLVACTRAYVAESLAAGKDHLVTDALLPFIPSLVAWGHDEASLVQVMEDLSHAVQQPRSRWCMSTMTPKRHCDVPSRGGDAWEDWYVRKLADSPGTRGVHDLSSAAAHLRFEGELTRRLLARTPWHVLNVNVGTLNAQEAYAHTRDHLTDMLELPGRPLA